MELLLNLTWLVVSLSLGVLFLASRRRCEALPGKCVYRRSVAGITYVILIALLLPAISMTDDRMAMVTPADSEQVARRYEVSQACPHHPNLQMALLHAPWSGLSAPLQIVGNLEIIHALDAHVPAVMWARDGRAPPVVL